MAALFASGPFDSLKESFATIRRTQNAHLCAVDALERAFEAELLQISRDRKQLEEDREAMLSDVADQNAKEALKIDALRRAVSKQRLEIEADQATLRAERAELDDEVSKLLEANPPQDQVVLLNVGGVRFQTSRAVLTKVEDSMLGRMFGRCDAMLRRADDGSVFIDRDGVRFKIILDLLRGDLDRAKMHATLKLLPVAMQSAMAEELDYFGLEAAVFGARPLLAFRPGPDMGAGRSGCVAVAAGGKVVVFGGNLGGATSTTELLDARTMAFTEGPCMLTEREGCAAVQLDAGRVLVVGGEDATAGCLCTTEILNLKTLTFSNGPELHSARNSCAAVALDAKRILVIGGFDGASFWASTEILHLDTLLFSPGPNMTSRRMGCAAVRLDSKRILVVGGLNSGRLNSTEILDVETMQFSPGPSMATARCYCAAVRVDGQHLLVVGGQNQEYQSLLTTELLDVATMEFEPGPTMATARRGCAAARLDAKRVVVVGGAHVASGGQAIVASTEVLALAAAGDASNGALNETARAPERAAPSWLPNAVRELTGLPAARAVRQAPPHRR